MSLPPPFQQYVTHSMQNSPAKRKHLAAYAAAVRAATIEECAKVCEKFKTGEDGYIDDDWADMCAAAIRALKAG